MYFLIKWYLILSAIGWVAHTLYFIGRGAVEASEGNYDLGRDDWF